MVLLKGNSGVNIHLDFNLYPRNKVIHMNIHLITNLSQWIPKLLMDLMVRQYNVTKLLMDQLLPHYSTSYGYIHPCSSKCEAKTMTPAWMHQIPFILCPCACPLALAIINILSLFFNPSTSLLCKLCCVPQNYGFLQILEFYLCVIGSSGPCPT